MPRTKSFEKVHFFVAQNTRVRYNLFVLALIKKIKQVQWFLFIFKNNNRIAKSNCNRLIIIVVLSWKYYTRKFSSREIFFWVRHYFCQTMAYNDRLRVDYSTNQIRISWRFDKCFLRSAIANKTFPTLPQHTVVSKRICSGHLE